MATQDKQAKQKKRSGIPTGNAGEYFVMGELLHRGFDAQLANRNTKGYDLLVGHEHQAALRKVQVKSVRSAPRYVRTRDFTDDSPARRTIYVLVGKQDATKPVRYFITRNRALKKHLHSQGLDGTCLHAIQGRRTVRGPLGFAGLTSGFVTGRKIDLHSRRQRTLRHTCGRTARHGG
jgi:hypothetical protein